MMATRLYQNTARSTSTSTRRRKAASAAADLWRPHHQHRAGAVLQRPGQRVAGGGHQRRPPRRPDLRRRHDLCLVGGGPVAVERGDGRSRGPGVAEPCEGGRCHRDRRLAAKADTGDPVAQTGLATAYLAGIGVAKDDAEGGPVDAVGRGSRLSAGTGALFHRPRRSKGTSTNRRNELEKAAAKASRPHRTISDSLYAVGQGVPKDMKKAASYYFRKAADQSSPEAQNNLGVLYANTWRGRQEEPEGKEVVRQGSGAGASRRAARIEALQQQTKPK